MYDLNWCFRTQRDQAAIIACERDRAHSRRVRERQMCSGPDHLVDRVERYEAVAVEAELGLHLQQPACRVTETGERESSTPRSLYDGADRGGHVRGRQDNVGAGLEGTHGSFADPVRVGDRAHRERVREEHAVEGQVRAQQTGEDVWRERRGWPVGTEHVGQRDVCRHDRVDAFLDRPVERNQLERVQARAVGEDHREADVRIDRSVTVAGEVLAGGICPALLGATNERGAQARDQLGIGAEGSARDDRVVGVVVHVEHRREEQVHAARACLDGCDTPIFVREALVTDRAERHRRRKLGATALRQHGRQRVRAVDAHARSAVLEVGGHQQRNLRACL